MDNFKKIINKQNKDSESYAWYKVKKFFEELQFIYVLMASTITFIFGVIWGWALFNSSVDLGIGISFVVILFFIALCEICYVSKKSQKEKRSFLREVFSHKNSFTELKMKYIHLERLKDRYPKYYNRKIKLCKFLIIIFVISFPITVFTVLTQYNLVAEINIMSESFFRLIAMGCYLFLVYVYIYKSSKYFKKRKIEVKNELKSKIMKRANRCEDCQERMKEY